MSAIAPLAGTLIGGLIFGPAGALIGSALGSILAPAKAPNGPRWSNLKIQTSSYGEMLPIPYGAMRYPGKVVWFGNNGEYVEHEHGGGGKGGTEPSTFSYTASAAVKFTKGPTALLKRLWADSKLVYSTVPGEVEDQHIPMTIYLGVETAGPDPTIEADKGVGNVPAFRDDFTIVFTDWDITVFGHLPSLNAEIVQSAGDIPWRVSTFTPDADAGGLRGATYDSATGVITVDRYYNSSGGQYRQRHYDIYGNPTGVDVDAASGLATVYQASNSSLVFSTVAGHFDQNKFVDQNITVQTNVTNPFGGDQDNTVSGPMMVDGDVLYAVGFEGTFGAVGVASYPLAGNVPGAFAAAAYVVGNDPTYSPSNLKMIPSDDDFVWFYYLGIGGSGFTTLYKCEPTTLALVHQWNPADLPTNTFLHSGYSYGIYNGMLCFNDGSNCVVYTINGDFTFTLVGSIPQILGPCIPLGDGLFLGTDGVISLVPPEDVTTLADILEDISVSKCEMESGAVDVSDPKLQVVVPGYALTQQAAGRDGVKTLIDFYFVDAVESGTQYKYVPRGNASVVTIPSSDMAARAHSAAPPAIITTHRAQEEDLPAILNVTCLDPAAWYQTATQMAQRQVTRSQDARTADFGIAASAATLKFVAETLLYNGWNERMQYTFSLPLKYIIYEPTDVVIANGIELRITSESLSANGIVTFEGVASHQSIWVGGFASDSGSGTSHPPTPPGSATITADLLNLPLINDTDSQYGFYAGAPGRATLNKSTDGGTTYSAAATIATGSPEGASSDILGDWTGGNMFDEINSVTVVLTHGELSSATELAVLNGANLCSLGQEVLQFRDATLIAADTYTLTGLLRGRFGTEYATVGHAVGDPFDLLPVTNVVGVLSDLSIARLYKPVPPSGTLALATAQSFINTGRGLRCYSPTSLGGGLNAGGNFDLNWINRTRIGGAWLPYIDVPLSEVTEQYIVSLWDSTYTICAAFYTVTAAKTKEILAADIVTLYGAAQQDIFFTVMQLGSYGPGSQAYGSVPGGGGSNNAPLVPIAPYIWVPDVPPPGPSGPVDHTFPSSPGGNEALHLTFTSGHQWVGQFTTPASGNGTIQITVSEYGAPPAFRHGYISDNSGGAGSIGASDSIGQTCSVYGVYGSGGFLAHATTYYFVLNFLGLDGNYLESPGSTHPSILEFHS